MKLHHFAAALLCGILVPLGMQTLPAGAVTFCTGETVQAQASQTQVLPASFDLRTRGCVTPVRRQGGYGMCWCFSTLASLESTLVPKLPEVDLSEWNLAYYAYSGEWGLPLQDVNGKSVDAFHQGGNFYVAAPMLTGWRGPVTEELFPYGDKDVLEPALTIEELQAMAAYHVTDMDMLYYDIDEGVTAETRQAVKEMVYSGQAAAMSYYNCTDAFNAADAAFYNADNKREGGNYHAVCIVGWDDDYDASHFLNDPGMDGAFLCKNSWGETWGDGGYFWISYADPSIVELYTVRGEDVQQHDSLYMHDTYGFWTAFSISEAETSDHIANVFTASEDSIITDVMFVTALPEENYSIRVYKDVAPGKSPASGTSSGKTRGVMKHPGYHTVTLDEPVFVSQGETFAVSVHLSGEMGQHIPCEAYTRITTEFTDGTSVESESHVPESFIEQTLHPGESWYSLDGRTWHDIYDEELTDETYTDDDGSTHHVYGRIGHACVRAVTRQPERVYFSDYSPEVAAGTPIALTCPGAEEIWYSFDGASWELYEAPVPITEETELYAYAVLDGGSCPAENQHYRIRTARLTSLQRTDNHAYLPLEALTDTCYTAICLPGDDPMGLYPVTTAQLTSPDGEFASGVKTMVDGTNAVTMTASGEGMQDTTYVIYLTDVIQGNVDLDDAITAADAADVLIYAAAHGAGTIENEPDAAWLDRADCNKDGLADASDAAWILQYAADRGAN